MKKSNKKGFTIVELVIVIAVIAILAAVMIPTFDGVIKKANQSAVMQKATAAYKEAYALDLSDGELDYLDDGETITVDGLTYEEDLVSYTDGEYIAVYRDGKWTVIDPEGATTVAPEGTTT